MIDIATLFDPDSFTGDWALDGVTLKADGSLRTPILLSLLTDARATPDDLARLPAGTDPRGSWAAIFDQEEDDLGGSRLWTLRRAKETNETFNRARTMAEEALAWLIRDGIAIQLTVEAEAIERGWLGLRVTLRLSSGAIDTYDFELEA